MVTVSNASIWGRLMKSRALPACKHLNPKPINPERILSSTSFLLSGLDPSRTRRANDQAPRRSFRAGMCDCHGARDETSACVVVGIDWRRLQQTRKTIRSVVATHRLLRSSFWGLPYRTLNMNHKKELLRGLWVQLLFSVSLSSMCLYVCVRACGAVAILGLTVVCWRCCQSLNIAEFPSVRIRMRSILDFDLGSPKP